MLRLHQLRKSFGSIRAVDDLSLDIGRGELFGLLGPNGAGKTTTVNMILGLVVPDGGSVELEGQQPTHVTANRRRLGVAPQSLAIYEELTGDENVTFFGRLYGLGGRALRERVDWAIEFVGLGDRRKDLARNYSGGMKRRLNLAVGIVHGPEMLLLDEPTVGVDPQSRNAIFDKIKELRGQGVTIIYTTHYMEEAQRLCDRVGIIDQGKLIALDTVENLIRTHGGPDVVRAMTDKGEIELASDDPISELHRLRSGGQLISFRQSRPDLESVFLHLTGRSLRD